MNLQTSNGAAAARTDQVISAKCPSCDLEISFQTRRPLLIERFAGGGGALVDAHGRPLCCPFCREPMDGALYRKRI